MSQFVAEPQSIRYKGAKGLADLTKYLDDTRATRPLLIRHPEDVLLSLEGKVQQCYRFTPWGLWSLCRRLSPNLGSVIADLTGISKRPSANTKVDVQAAVMVLNTIIRSRFGGC